MDEEKDGDRVEVEDEDEVEDEEVWGPWLPAGPSGGLISGMCASLATSSSNSSSTSSFNALVHRKALVPVQALVTWTILT